MKCLIKHVRLKPTTLLAYLVFLLSACSSVEYKARQATTPDGYSERQIDQNRYEITYETYLKVDDASLLNTFALNRAAEIANDKDLPFILIESESFSEYEDVRLIPEYTRVHLFQGKVDTHIDSSFEAEITIPGHFKTFDISKLQLRVSLLEEHQEGAVKAQDILSGEAPLASPNH